MRIGFIGAGRMGRPMVSQLVAAGHEVRVLARSDGSRRALAETGAQPVTGLAAAGRAADAVLVCVFTDEQVREVCLGGELLARMPSGGVLAIHTTGSPRTAEVIAAQASPRGIAVIDAPVSGGPHDIAAGRLTLFLGGAADAVARLQPVLASYGDPILHVGPVGAAQRVKLVNNALFAANIGLLAEAVRLGRELGVAEEALLAALPHASGASRALAGVAARGSVAAFAGAVGGFVAKDVAVARTVAAELGGHLGVLDDAIAAMTGA
jgi:3-hydroxyisobutyrate dehydrogenase-like beta-hydroxyacid dehydrogenase